jgi:hypothetical protein
MKPDKKSRILPILSTPSILFLPQMMGNEIQNSIVKGSNLWLDTGCNTGCNIS